MILVIDCVLTFILRFPRKNICNPAWLASHTIAESEGQSLWHGFISFCTQNGQTHKPVGFGQPGCIKEIISYLKPRQKMQIFHENQYKLCKHIVNGSLAIK